MAVVEPGRLVMLDEPTNDVDPVRRRLMWQQVRDLAANGCGVIVVTHNVAEAERGVDRIVVLDKGHIVASGTPPDLRLRASGELRLEVTLALDAAPPAPPPWAGPASVTGTRMIIPLTVAEAQQAVAWAQQLRTAASIVQFALNPISLEDVYVGLTGTAHKDRHESMAA